MSEQTHLIAGLIATGVGIIGYVPYYRDIFRGSTRPHPFTWFGFAVINAISFVAQVVSGAGPGAWVTGVTTIATLGIAVLSLQKGEKQITVFDWVCLAGSFFAVVLWKLTDSPLWAIVTVTVANVLAFAPTFRKAYLRPREETPALYMMSTLKYGISLWALSNFNFVTAFFPIVITPLNFSIAVLIFVRRSMENKKGRIANKSS